MMLISWSGYLITSDSTARLHVFIAQNAPTAAILRQGPSKQVLLIKWNLNDDSFEYGQWFKGRIYEDQCDISPNGTKFIYFASKFIPPFKREEDPYHSPLSRWTAISKPPYFTAIALWAQQANSAGGGFFESEKKIILNHAPNEMELSPGFSVPSNTTILSYGDKTGWSWVDAILKPKWLRDGWRQLQDGKKYTSENFNDSTYIQSPNQDPEMQKIFEMIHNEQCTFADHFYYIYSPPLLYSKTKRFGPGKEISLIMQIYGKDQKGKIIYYQIEDTKTKQKIPLGRLNWSDWDKNGDLIFTKQGRLYRLKPDVTKSKTF